MDDQLLRRYEPPALGGTPARVCPRICVQAGVSFEIVLPGDEADVISRPLARGVYPPSYQQLLRLLQATVPRGGRVLDLGTHVGTFSLGAAAAGYHVLGVEASPKNAALLQASIERNGFERFRLVHAAATDRPGSLQFHQEGPYGHVAAEGPTGQTVTVPAVRVDDLLAGVGWDGVDFIKMDIEGSEVAALRGMSRLLERRKAPPLFVESNGHTLAKFGESPASLRRALEGFGYRVYLAESGRIRPLRRGEIQTVTCVDYLALRRRPRGDRRYWRVDGPLTRAEQVDRAAWTCRSALPQDRRYIAAALAESSRPVREPRLLNALEHLRADPDETTRSLAGAIPVASPRSGWLARLLR